MARVTVEDSLEKIPNRFDLILIASKRARILSMTGQEPTVPWNNDKPTVVALREIAAGNIGPEIMNVKPEVLAAEAFDFSIDHDKLNVTRTKIVDIDDDFAMDDDENSFDQQVIAVARTDFEEVPIEKHAEYDESDSEETE